MIRRRLLLNVLLLGMLLGLPLQLAAQTSNRLYLPVIGQSPTPTPPPPLPVYNYAAAMRSPFEGEANRPDLPHYDLTLRLDPVGRRMTGRVDVWFRNTTGAVLNDVVLRLYPNVPADIFNDGRGTSTTVSNSVVQGVATAPRYEAQNTAIRFPLPRPVGANEVIRVALDFQTVIVPRPDGTFPIQSAYPMLAAWDGGWRTDVFIFPDRVYANSGLYHARITAPNDWTPISSGITLQRIANGDGTTTLDVVTGPVREFMLSVGRFGSASLVRDGADLVVWYPLGKGLDALAQSVLAYMDASFVTYNVRYGPYPFRALEAHLILDLKYGDSLNAATVDGPTPYDAFTAPLADQPAPNGHDDEQNTAEATGGSHYYGIEYPGLIMIFTSGRNTTGLRYVTEHEVAHQWFYGILGNDVFNQPWLDESFANFSPYLVEGDRYGASYANSYYQSNVAGPASRTTLPAGYSVYRYGNWSTYVAGVYGKGAQFLYVLRGRIGETAFHNGMRTYYTRHKYGIVRRADFLRAMEEASGQDLDAFFAQWLGN
jgi:hypothetical protein